MNMRASIYLFLADCMIKAGKLCNNLSKKALNAAKHFVRQAKSCEERRDADGTQM